MGSKTPLPEESKLWLAIKRRNKAKRTKAHPAFAEAAERDVKAEAQKVVAQLNGESIEEIVERLAPLTADGKETT